MFDVKMNFGFSGNFNLSIFFIIFEKFSINLDEKYLGSKLNINVPKVLFIFPFLNRSFLIFSFTVSVSFIGGKYQSFGN